MKSINAVGSIVAILAALTLGAGATGNDPTDGLTRAPATECVSPAAFPGDFRVEHAIWQRPRLVAPGHVPRDSKIWI